TRRAGPVGVATRAERMAREDGRTLASEGVVRGESQQSKRVFGEAGDRAEAAVVAILPPEPIGAAAAAESRGRLAGRLRPPRLAGPFAHREGGEERPGRSPTDVVRGVLDVRTDEPMQVLGEPRVRGE